MNDTPSSSIAQHVAGALGIPVVDTVTPTTVANDSAERFGMLPTLTELRTRRRAGVRAMPETGPNDYVRRADIEALIDDRIAELTQRAASERHHLEAPETDERRRAYAVNAEREAKKIKAALGLLRVQVGMCPQYTYRTFSEYGSGATYNSLVAATADRVPLDPVKTEDGQRP